MLSKDHQQGQNAVVSEVNDNLAAYQIKAMQLYNALRLAHFQGSRDGSSQFNSALIGKLSQISIDNNDEYWLGVSGEMGSASALYFLAMRATQDSQRQRYLAQAASLGHPQGQFEWAMLQTESADRIALLNDAATQNYTPAKIALGKHYFELGQLSQAQKWLSLAAPVDALSAFKLGRIYWQNDQQQLSIEAFELSESLGYKQAKGYISVLNQTQKASLASWIAKSTSVKNTNVPSQVASDITPRIDAVDCLQTVAMIATSLSSMVQASSFYARFNNDERLATLPICLQKPEWVDANELTCSAKTSQNRRLSCDLTPLASKIRDISYTHIIVFGEEGKANVNNGIMYLDKADVYSVFVHELAHFAGFVDEYALASELADFHCEANKAPNLLLQQDNLFTPDDRAKLWASSLAHYNSFLEDDEQILITASKTCKNARYKSFKPSNRMTFMEFHDVEYIPQMYLSLWRAQLIENKGSVPIAVNFANAAWEANLTDEALYWSSLF